MTLAFDSNIDQLSKAAGTTLRQSGGERVKIVKRLSRMWHVCAMRSSFLL